MYQVEMSRETTGKDVEFTACDGIAATVDIRDRVILLGFYGKGVADLLTYDKALALGRVLSRMAQATTRPSGG